MEEGCARGLKRQARGEKNGRDGCWWEGKEGGGRGRGEQEGGGGRRWLDDGDEEHSGWGDAMKERSDRAQERRLVPEERGEGRGRVSEGPV